MTDIDTTEYDQRMIHEYTEWGLRLMAHGYRAHMLTFMFNPLPGSDAAVAELMDREVERIYARLLTRTWRTPDAAANRDRKPVWFVVPDYPVGKHGFKKDHISNIIPNDGRHTHTLSFDPIGSRLQRGMASFIEDNEHLYAGTGKALQRLHAEPVTFTPEVVIEYVFKNVKRRRVRWDGVFVLPRTNSEMSNYGRAERQEMH